MKAVSASIVILAAAVVHAGGSQVSHSDTRGWIQLSACLLGGIGLYSWRVYLIDKQD
jgi:hypothetical protein